MARVAFVMDKLLRRIGLSGRSIVPMLIGFGCTVPGVMASRTLPSERDRKMTILLTPFMSCSAKLPIYSLFAGLFFPEHAALVMVGLYFLGILIGVAVAFLLERVRCSGARRCPLCDRNCPTIMSAGAEKRGAAAVGKSPGFFPECLYCRFFLATIVIWFLQNFDLQLSLTSGGAQNSILALLAGWSPPLFAPLGFADWRISTALIWLYGQGERCFHSGGAVRQRSRTGRRAPACRCRTAAGILPAVHPLCGSSRLGQTGAGRQMAAIMVAEQCLIAWVCALLVRFIALAIL